MARATSAPADAHRKARLAMVACLAVGWGMPFVLVVVVVALLAVAAGQVSRGAWTLALLVGAPVVWGSLSLLRPRRLRPRVVRRLLGRGRRPLPGGRIRAAGA